MEKTFQNLKHFTYLSIAILIAFISGLAIGICTNKYYQKVQLYNEYQQVVEQLLDECDDIHNISDTVCEGDTYAEYMGLREKLGLE